jgi:hypothetical protein
LIVKRKEYKADLEKVKKKNNKNENENEKRAK